MVGQHEHPVPAVVGRGGVGPRDGGLRVLFRRRRDEHGGPDLRAGLRGPGRAPARLLVRHGPAAGGIPGSGKVSLDIHVKAEGHLKVTSALKDYDGPIPGVANLDIPIAGDVAFDPFLVGDGETASVVADLPEVDLPDIPLGSVPGKLQIHVAKGSTVTSAFHGSCLAIADGQASYKGELETSGTLVLRATIALDLPMPLDKSITLPDITVPIKGIKSAVDLGSVNAAGVADATSGACGAAPAPADGKDGTAGPDGGGPKVCGGADMTGACGTCLNTSCCDAWAACGGDDECIAIFDCTNTCNGDDACFTQCESDHPNGTANEQALLVCLAGSCTTACQ
jgi:hypothetical protein